MRSFETILVSLSLSLLAFAAHGVNHAHRHANLTIRDANLTLRPRQEYTGIRMTWYDITTGTYVPLLYPHCPCLTMSLQDSLWWQLCTK